MSVAASDPGRRTRKMTEKGQEFLSDQMDRCVKKFNDCYSKWKQCARDTRKNFKNESSSVDLDSLLHSFNKSYEAFLASYVDLKSKRAPSKSEVEKADCVTQIFQDFHEVFQKIQSKPLNKEAVKFNVRTILDNSH